MCLTGVSRLCHRRALTPNGVEWYNRAMPERTTRRDAPATGRGVSATNGANRTYATNTSFQTKGGESVRMETKGTMVTKPTTGANAPDADVSGNTPEAPKSDEVTETAQTTQLTAIEIKLVNTAELLKTHAEAISVNVRNAREDDEKGFALVSPTTVMCRNLGILDDPDNRDNPAIGYVQDRLAAMDIPVNVAEYLELAHMVANALKAPDLAKLDDPDVKAEADKLRDVLKAAEYLDAGESIINTAKLAIGVYDASMTSLREWQNKGKSTKSGTTPGPTSMPANRDIVDNARKLRSTDKIRENTGWDVEYVCGEHRVTHGDALSSTKHYIRAAYREANNLPETAGAAGTPEWADLGPSILKALDSGENVEWGNGYIHRVAPTG